MRDREQLARYREVLVEIKDEAACPESVEAAIIGLAVIDMVLQPDPGELHEVEDLLGEAHE